MPYKRPDTEAAKAELAALTEKLRNAASYEEARAVFLEKEEMEKEVGTMSTLAYVRHSIDTRDEVAAGLRFERNRMMQRGRQRKRKAAQGRPS